MFEKLKALEQKRRTEVINEVVRLKTKQMERNLSEYEFMNLMILQEELSIIKA